jgi:hypothetical protein
VPLAAIAALAVILWRRAGDHTFGAYAFAGAALDAAR